MAKIRSVRGSRASRTESPSRLNPSVVISRVSEGKIQNHQSWKPLPWASASMLPQVGVGGPTPTPR